MMNFISRIGLGNLAAILALAAVPFVALAFVLVYGDGPSDLQAAAEKEKPASSGRASQ